MNVRTGIAILSLTTLCDCGSAPHRAQAVRTVDEAAKPRQFALDAMLTKVGPRRVAVHAITDLPDETNLLVSLQRSYWERKDQDTVYAGEIFSKDLPVKDGKVSVEIDIDDSVWVKAHDAKKEEFVPLGLWDRIGKISSGVTARVLYSSMRDQPDSVKKILGPKGELILQPGKSPDPFITIMTIEKELPLQFKP